VLFDGRSVPTGEEIQSDVCIIGAGPAGITLALEWITAGFRVCLLESGGRKLERSVQRLSDGASVGYPYFRLSRARGRAFGGTSCRWELDVERGEEGWNTRPLDALDFEARAEIPHSGWPFGRAELEPYYVRAQAISRLGPYRYSPEAWEEGAVARRLPLDDSQVVTSIFLYGRKTFGDHLEQLVRADRVSVFLHATATELVTDEGTKQVSRVTVVGGLSRRFSVAAKIYVVAAGGIENARLLLLSNGAHAAGLGNENNLVGRFFMERPTVRTGILTPSEASLLERVRLYAVHNVRGARVRAALSVSEAMLRKEGLLNSTFFLWPTHRAFASDGIRSLVALYRAVDRRPRPAPLTRHARMVAANLDDVARTAYRDVIRRGARRNDVLLLRAQAEQAPNPDSRVMLDERRDGLGLRQVRLDWRLSELDLRSIRRAQEILDVAFGAAGLGRLEHKLGEEDPPALVAGGYHHMGTTRMHRDPKRGVVDEHCRVHALSNLYIAGSSVFPTSGYANPTLTIVALAVRLGDHIRSLLQR
jgi:choline dehydrogenase-like flavoprotein